MSLLPIIYTSLVLFAGILFFVLIVSYISFKLKSGGKGPRYQQLEIAQPAPIIAPVRTVQSKVAVKESYPLDYSKLEKRIQYQTSSLNHYRNEVPQSQVERRPRQMERTTRYQTNNNGFSQSRGNENSRIQIMNTSERMNNSFSVPSQKYVTKSAHGLSDMNLLSYYSDRNDNGFVSLTAF